MNKKRFACFCLALLCAVLVWLLMPHSFTYLTIPYRNGPVQNFGSRPAHSTYLAASDDLGSHHTAQKDVTDTLSQHTFRLDPRSLIPSLYQPKKPVDVCISYFSYGANGGFLLWDGEHLWIGLTKNLFSAYRPDDPILFQQHIGELVEKYSGYKHYW